MRQPCGRHQGTIGPWASALRLLFFFARAPPDHLTTRFLDQVPPSYHEDRTGLPHSSWVLCNDFALSEVSEVEAITYDLRWKVRSP